MYVPFISIRENKKLEIIAYPFKDEAELACVYGSTRNLW